MERSLKRWKSASVCEGLPQVQKYRAVCILPSDSNSYGDSGIRNDKSVEIGQSSVGPATDRPSTKLLAGRVYEETAPKKRSLRGIARLLRGERLPSLWNTHKRKRSLSDSYQSDNTSINIEPNRQLYDGQPIRRSPKKQQEFEDVDENVDESSSVDGRYSSSRWTTSLLLSKSEMALIQRNLASKRLTYDETVSEKFYDLKERDGMLGSRVLRKQFGRKNNSFSDHVYHPKEDGGLLLDPDYRHNARVAHQCSPKPGDMQNHHGSSPYQSQGYSRNSANMTGYPSVKSAKELSWRKSESYYDTGDDNRIGDDKRASHPSSRSVDEEAKKRLAERWKLTHKYLDLEIVGMSSTPGEMLSMPHGDQKSKQTASRIDRSSRQMGADNRSPIRHGLLGTISRGASKDKTERPSRSRSVPSIGGSIRGRGTCHDMLGSKKHVLHSEPIRHGTSKVSKHYPNHKDHFSSQILKLGKKLLPYEEMDSSVEAWFEIQMEANVKELPPQQLTFQMAEKDDCCGSDDVSEIVAADAEHVIPTLLSRTSVLHSDHFSVDNESTASTADDQKVFCPQELSEGVSKEVAPSSNSLEAEPVSLGSSKDAGHASSISVLGTPLLEDASSRSECSDEVSAEVDDLTMQLHLLKMDSSAYDNSSTHIPVEKDTIRADSWEASYTLDVLILAGLENFDFDLFRIMWHTPHHPLDSRLFDILEERYCSNEMAGTTSRQQRMLLFDTINSALSDIFLNYVDILPWAMPKLAGSMLLMLQKERARYNVERLIESANGLQVIEGLLDRETHWPDPTEEIALTGNEIEELLLDDLINEFLFEL